MTPEEEVKVEEKETPEVKDDKTEEIDPLEQKRQEILKGSEEVSAPEKEEEKEEIETEEIDWDAFKEEFPQIDKLGIENFKDMAKRYFGGLDTLNTYGEVVAALKEAGVDVKSPEGRAELAKRLKAGGDIKIPPATEEKPTDFASARKESFKSLIPKQVQTGETDEEGNPLVRNLTEEELQAEVDRFNDSAELIYPSEHAEKVARADLLAIQTLDDRTWEQFQIGRLLKEKFKDEIIPDDIRSKIMDYMEDFPATRNEIIRKARESGKNYWEALHNYWLSQVKRDDINREKETEIRKDIESELKKKQDKVTETKKTKGEPLETSTSFEKLPLMSKRKLIEEGKA